MCNYPIFVLLELLTNLIIIKTSTIMERPTNLPQNQYLLSNGTMHEDAQSSDTTIAEGPGASEVKIEFNNLVAACPTIFG